ncbi:MAG: xanthine dehydrogenase family protein molybdopterin-binding subunit [Methylobacteriaceae bacterium]|nr:xanthine dehydrogenase family protein molybdopterin-binding subunit [Methylobacteriaceae bacterium]
MFRPDRIAAAAPSRVTTPSRRGVLGGAGALVLGFTLLPKAARAQAPAAAGQFPYRPNAFLRIAPDDTVTVLSKHLEMGQGPWTGLTTLVAEELDAAWSQMRAEHAPHDDTVFANLLMGQQLTGGSTAIANSYLQMRKVGAAARAMLVAAAAEAWRVPAGEVSVSEGVLRHPSGRTARFGELAEAAARQPVPTDIQLKEPSAFRLVGTDLPKPDTVAKTTGQARYTLDQRSEDMLVAVVAHPPRFGGKPKEIDDREARKVPGVVGIKFIPQGVAVLARSTFAALKARDALQVTWDESEAWTTGSEALIADYTARSREPGLVAKKAGDPAATLAAAGGQVIEQVYVFPYLAHAPMEPLDCLARFDGDRVHLSYGSQAPTIDAGAVGAVFGLPPSAVTIDVQLAGGSFGRRAQQDGTFAAEAAECAKAAGRGVPVKLVWTREDDMRGGKYRPLYVHRLRAAIGPDKSIAAWHHTIVGQSIGKGTPLEPFLVENGIDATSVEGAADLPYRLANFQCDLHTTDTKVPVLWWRSVGHTHTAYATETFLDLLLEKTGRDPVAGRLELLRDHPRETGVLKAAAELAGWTGRLGANGRGYGVAVHKSFDTYVAQIAEVSRGPDGMPKVHKVWCAVDCGVAVNPNIIRAQMESGIGFGLGHALFAEIELGPDGQVVQGNFDTYRSLRIGEMPAIETVIVRSGEHPTGIGEPGVPPTGPAVANAWRSLTGQIVARLPFTRQILV